MRAAVLRGVGPWLAMLVTVSLAMLAGAAPTVAAASPREAVMAFVELVDRGQLEGIDEVVCPGLEAGVLEAFDPSTALGFEALGIEVGDALRLRLDEPSTELISQEADSALVRLTASLRFEVDKDPARDAVRALLEAGGDEVGDADFEDFMSELLAAFAQTQPLDEDVLVELRDGDWLVCGGLGIDGATAGSVEPSVSFDGLCGLVPLSDINAVGPVGLEYDSTFGAETFCAYDPSTEGQTHSLTVSLSPGDRLDDYRAVYPDGSDVTVAGLEGYVLDSQLFVAVPEGILEVFAFPGDPELPGFASTDYLSAVATLFIAPIADYEFESDLEAGPDSGLELDFPEDQSGPSLCDALSLDQLNGLSPLRFDDASGDSTYCAYTAIAPEGGIHIVGAGIDYLSVDDFKTFFPDGQDLEIEGQQAYAQGEQVWVQIDIARAFSVAAFIEDDPEAEDVDPLELALEVTRLALPAVLEMDLGPLPSLDDPGTSGSDGGGPSICDYLDIEAVNALGSVTYDDVWDGTDVCLLSSDTGSGFSSLTVYREFISLDELKAEYPGGSSRTVAGAAAYSDGEVLWVATMDGPIAIAVVLDDVPELAGVDAIDHAAEVAALIVAALGSDDAALAAG